MLGNVKEIEKLYNGLNNGIILGADDETTRAADEAFNDYIEKSGIVGNAGISKRRMELDDLVSRISYENERQGFVKGFRYALNLLIDEKSAQG